MGRIILIGDVHGCRPELDQLLDRVALAAGDGLCFVGDLVARGPDSTGVLDLASELGASMVRGNHEWRLLEARAARARGDTPPRLGPSHRTLMDELEDRHWAALEAMTSWVDYPDHELRVVHAGVVPGIPIEQQDKWVLAHLRTLRADGSPSDKRDFTLWAERYREAPHVVFGHNAVDGLQLHSHATGIDTGCVYGGRLTAMVLGPGQRVPPEKHRRDVLVSVRARKAYVELKPGV